MKKSMGFTLIELLVVIFIISILAGLVIINVSNARKSGRDAKRIANLKSIQTALELYVQKNQTYPSTMNTSGGRDIICVDIDPLKSALVPNYIPNMPADPKPIGGDCYKYQSNGQDFKLQSASMETINGIDPSATDNPTSIQEIDDPTAVGDTTNPSTTIAIYTSGASTW